MAKLVGPQKRAQDREKRRKNLEKKARQALEKYQPKLFHPKPIADDFERGWIKVNDELLKKFGTRWEYISAVKYLSSFLHKLAKEHQLDMKLPTRPVRIKRTRPMRTPQWQQLANQQIYTHRSWLDALQHSSSALDLDNLYTAILCSAIYHSGLATPDEVVGFTQVLQSTRPLSRQGNLTYVEFEFQSKSFNTNVYQADGEKVSFRRLYLSPLTLSLLNIARKRRQNGESWQAPKTAKSCWKLVRKYMGQFGETPSSFRLFCKTAVAVTEFGNGLRIPQALLEYAVGRNHSYSLPIDNQRRLITPNIKPLERMSVKDLLGIVPAALPKNQSNRSGNNNYGIYKQLLLATRTKDENEKKRSKIDAYNAVSEILESGLEEHEFRLVHWLVTISLKNEVSTVRRYVDAIAKEWLAYSSGQELDDMSSEDYWEWFSQLIDMSTTFESKKFNAGRYQQFHQHCAAYFSAPVLEEVLPYANDTDIRPHTRSAFINETLFHAMLLAIENFTNFTDQEKLQYQCIAILGYRCGLRLGEILKLQINDIELSDVSWLTVRENQYGNNKSNAAYRKVPLIPLLVTHPQKDELTTFSEYAKISALLRERRSRAGEHNILLFSQPHNSGIKLAQSNVSRILKTILTHLSGLSHFVEHHLRHSCISRMQFIIHAEDVDDVIASGELKEILPYDKQKCQDILDLICTKNKRDRYWAVASFAGHSSPETTFNNYYHFSDMILGYLVNQRSDAYGQAFLHHLSGISKKKLKDIVNNTSNIELKDIIPELLDQVKKWNKVPLKRREYKASGLTIQKRRISLDTCYQVLKCYEQGISPQDLLYIYQVKDKELQKWLHNACYISDLTTSKGNSRFNAKDRTNKLLPARLNFREENRYVERFAEAIRKAYPSKKDELKWAFNYTLSYHAIEYGVYFNDPDEFQRFIQAFDSTIPRPHWRVASRAIEHHSNSTQWQDALKKMKLNKQVVSSKTGRAGHGGVYLKLANPQKSNETSPLLSYMLRMAIIMMMSIS